MAVAVGRPSPCVGDTGLLYMVSIRPRRMAENIRQRITPSWLGALTDLPLRTLTSPVMSSTVPIGHRHEPDKKEVVDG
jgi:hypothetical protein